MPVSFRPLVLAGIACLALLTGCTTPPSHFTPGWAQELDALLPTDVLLLGEQHDAPEHQRLEREAVEWLAARGQLAAVVMEMADAGRDTRELPRDAGEAQVQQALDWRDDGWPWERYGPVAMAAVRAGVPVLGGNLPRAHMREAMLDAAWDLRLPPEALRRQRQAIRDGHCGLLPESQIPGMARIQIARDVRMADTAAAARRPGRAVLLVAGGGHVQRTLGVPLYLPEDLQSKVALAQAGQAQEAMKKEADLVRATPPLPAKDHCAELRQGLGLGASTPPATPAR